MPLQKAGVYLVSTGAATAIGETSLATAAAVRAGIPGFAEHPFAIDQEAEPCIVAMASWLPPDLPVAERMGMLAEQACLEALQSSKLAWEKTRLPLLLGLPPQRPGISIDLEANLVARLSKVKPFTWTQTFATGHAAGLQAIHRAVELITAGSESVCLVGGVESYLASDTLEWLEGEEQLHQTSNAWGFIPGEAAGCCLLASGEYCERQQLTPLLQVLSAATGQEANRNKTDTVCTGQGLTQAFRGALQGLPEGRQVDDMICDMNGEAYRGDEMGFTLARTGKRFVDATRFTSPADCWGDVGAASGPLFVILTAIASQKRYTHGPHTLVWASSDSGERAAALLADATTQAR